MESLYGHRLGRCRAPSAEGLARTWIRAGLALARCPSGHALLLGAPALEELAELTFEEKPCVESVEADEALAEDAHLVVVERAERRAAVDRLDMNPHEGTDNCRVFLGQLKAIRRQVEEQLVVLAANESLLFGRQSREAQEAQCRQLAVVTGRRLGEGQD